MKLSRDWVFAIASLFFMAIYTLAYVITNDINFIMIVGISLITGLLAVIYMDLDWEK